MPTLPPIHFHGLRRLRLSLLEVAHNACEPGVEAVRPESPHRDDTLVVTLDLAGAPGESLSLNIGTERARIDHVAAQFEALAIQLREHGSAWKRPATCATCSTHVFDAAAEIVPHVATCPRCGDTRFEIPEGGAGGFQSAAKGEVGASTGLFRLPEWAKRRASAVSAWMLSARAEMLRDKDAESDDALLLAVGAQALADLEALKSDAAVSA